MFNILSDNIPNMFDIINDNIQNTKDMINIITDNIIINTSEIIINSIEEKISSVTGEIINSVELDSFKQNISDIFTNDTIYTFISIEKVSDIFMLDENKFITTENIYDFVKFDIISIFISYNNKITNFKNIIECVFKCIENNDCIIKLNSSENSDEKIIYLTLNNLLNIIRPDIYNLISSHTAHTPNIKLLLDLLNDNNVDIKEYINNLIKNIKEFKFNNECDNFGTFTREHFGFFCFIKEIPEFKIINKLLNINSLFSFIQLGGKIILNSQKIIDTAKMNIDDIKINIDDIKINIDDIKINNTDINYNNYIKLLNNLKYYIILIKNGTKYINYYTKYISLIKILKSNMIILICHIINNYKKYYLKLIDEYQMKYKTNEYKQKYIKYKIKYLKLKYDNKN